MVWECSECGGTIESVRAPVVCPECGVAGGVFVPVDVDDSLLGGPETGTLRAIWLRAGMEQTRPRAVAQTVR